jgi:thiosulfate/3-mercaptopyruvate sulfurtransferase
MGSVRFTVFAGLALVAFTGGQIQSQEKPADPWTPQQLMPVETLAKMMTGAKPPVIISVAFPVLYRNRHIELAVLAGPGRDAGGIADLKAVVKKLPKDTEIVIYCGCCPMDHCPNLRPAFRALRELGYTNIHALDIPTNFNTDWVTKGYPIAAPGLPAIASPGAE